MITETNRTDVIANNLSNANTTGYKRDVAVSSEFEPMLLRRVDDQNDRTDVTSFKGFSVNGGNAPVVGELGMGSYTAEIATNHEQGALHATGNPFDLAIAGAGYFAVQTPQGVRYTRNGNFYKQSDGRLVTANGQAVLNRQGQSIIIPNGTANIQIGSKGQVYADGQMVDTLQFVQFDNRRAVLKQGDSLYYPQEGAQPQPATGTIEQGMLEASNVNVVSDMVELINNYRMYEAGSKAVTTQDSMADKAVNEVGKV
jgi:flagellar basal-body rod protein FlgG